MTVWKPVFGYEGRYEISDDGKIRIVGKDSSGRSRYAGHILKCHPVRGYPHCILHAKGGKPKNKLVHIMVAEAFIGPRPDGAVVNHKDGNKSNASHSNLEYVSPAENHRHALTNALYITPSGEIHWLASIDDMTIKEIRKRALSGEKHQDLADEFGISIASVSRYRNGVGRSSSL